MIVLPIGPLQQTDLGVRLASAAVAAVIFFVSRRNMLLGVAAGVTTLVLLTVGGVRLT